MSLSTAEEDRIVNLLRDKKSSTTIVLVGKPGSGKTWLAKKLSTRANFDFILWACLNRKYDHPALYKSIAHQLFLHSIAKELKLDDNVDNEEVQEEENLEKLEEKLSKALEGKRMEPLVKSFVARIQHLPAAIFIVEKAYAFFYKLDSGVQTLERSLKEAFDGVAITSAIVDVHYNELIAYWILEGYLGSIDCVEQAYEKGHRILMELIDCGLLKKVEADCVVLERSVEADYILTERAKLNLDSCNRCGFDGIASLGLADLFEDGKWGGFGRITQAYCIIRTPCNGEKEKKLSTLLYGNHLCQEFLNKFNEPNHKLRVLAIFNPTFESLPLAFSFMKELNMLVLRGCDFLVKIDYIREFAKLTVLEISGACSLIKLPDDIFKKMNQLQSLNLSSLQIQSLPTSFYDLTELQRLLITDCPNLVKLKMLKNCDKHMLTHVLLRDCCAERLPSIEKLTCLQVLNLSGAKVFVEIQDPLLKANTDLEILDFSGTNVLKIPSNIRDSLSAESKEKFFEHLGKLQILNISETTIKGCHPFPIFPSSGSYYFPVAHPCVPCLGESADFLKNMVQLQILDLSETHIKLLPSMTKLKNLTMLFLRGCKLLAAVEDLEALTKLGVLDLSGTALTHLPSLSNLTNLLQLLLRDCPNLEKFSCPEMLDLSGPVIKELPYDISKLTHLEQLDMPNMMNIEGAEEK
ncbi:hypothetical protein Acr_00g0079130 [Actinidia rufa]|uniref:NB-ARC domain-containing protein n=1 Tax=Actinidia rufa TaxID=165716 RepID=A0A7J0DW58_9ERIC|nr:hypothetical protein Acr_00g0079130 [Actinidia rufa]